MKTYFSAKRCPGKSDRLSVSTSSSDVSGYQKSDSTKRPTTKTPSVAQSLESVNRITIKKRPATASLESKKGAIQTRQVIVTEVTNPKTFYVQDSEFKERADEIDRECNQCAMETKALSNAAVIDQMYLVLENKSNVWNRCIVKKHERKSVDVFLVDYGRTVRVLPKQ